MVCGVGCLGFLERIHFVGTTCVGTSARTDCVVVNVLLFWGFGTARIAGWKRRLVLSADLHYCSDTTFFRVSNMRTMSYSSSTLPTSSTIIVSSKLSLVTSTDGDGALCVCVIFFFSLTAPRAQDTVSVISSVGVSTAAESAEVEDTGE